jgi:hypothetical protein
MRKIQLFALLSLLIVSMTGCKYEEGPFISFVPKVERVTNSWIVSTAIVNGQQDTELDGVNYFTFYKEGNAAVSFNLLGTEIIYSGTWVFNEDKSTIILNTEDNSGFFEYNRTFTIKKLKEKEMQLYWEEEDGSGNNDTYDVVWVPRQL